MLDKVHGNEYKSFTIKPKRTESEQMKDIKTIMDELETYSEDDNHGE
jgi:hypothetical protein